MWTNAGASGREEHRCRFVRERERAQRQAADQQARPHVAIFGDCHVVNPFWPCSHLFPSTSAQLKRLHTDAGARTPPTYRSGRVRAMGAAASVVLPPERSAAIRQASRAAWSQAAHVAGVAHVGVVRVVRVAGHWYAVVDDRVLSPVHRVVEKQVVRRTNLLADHLEVLSKLCVQRMEIGKREYEVFNCGPELLDVRSGGKIARVLELRDPQVADFLLNKCLWAVWQPPASWRVKVDQIFDVTLYVAVRNHGFLTGETRVVRLRVGRKWVGAHHLNTDMVHSMKSQWLHRVDYEVGDQVELAESAFFQSIQAAWDDYLVELAKVPQEDLRASDETGDGFPYEEQEQRTSLRVKYLLDTSLHSILHDHRTMFRKPHQYELWRMEQEDSAEHREDCLEDRIAGPLLDGPIDELVELYEEHGMGAEDKDVQWS